MPLPLSISTSSILRVLPILLLLLPHAQSQPIRMNQIQVIGSHNSYHVQGHPDLLALIAKTNPDAAKSLTYNHRPLIEQLDRLGIRQFELDLYADPEGGLYAQPKGPALAGISNPERLFDPIALNQPGTKILHVPDVDFQTTTPTLTEALITLNNWSLEHPEHVPIMILLELKEDGISPEATQPLPWDFTRLIALEKEIQTILPENRLITPREVKGNEITLREAILNRGWPNLDDARGRFILALDNTDDIRDRYITLSRNHYDRILFVSVEETHPLAAWFKINNAEGDRDRIQTLVKQGFMVRTRADSGTRQSREFDYSTRDAAFASGAQFISTDYPEPNPTFSLYDVQLPNHLIARANPVIGLPNTRDIDLEKTLIPTLDHYSITGLEILNRKAFDTHVLRRLNEASVMYSQLLNVKPPAPLNADELELVLSLAPILYTHSKDPFPLKSAAAILHSTESWIAYHLFWEDDIDFPEDNDPADHEVLWIRFDPQTKRPLEQVTYFHGHLLRETLAPSQYPKTAIEWGKHGSLPMTSGGEWTPVLKRNWEKLNQSGIRMPHHGLARTWPKRFAGTYEEYTKFETPVSLSKVLQQNKNWVKSKWANAVLDQYLISFNFAPKIEWPTD